jgi:hypothetical protein
MQEYFFQHRIKSGCQQTTVLGLQTTLAESCFEKDLPIFNPLKKYDEEIAGLEALQAIWLDWTGLFFYWCANGSGPAPGNIFTPGMEQCMDGCLPDGDKLPLV